MRYLLTALTTVSTVLAALSWATDARAQEPVVVELFTSQGCSSCPPADAMLRELAEREDVIALGLHVDYWDYIGWADSFADPAHTERQKAYARAAGERMVYTPQMIVGGVHHVVGTRAMQVAALIERESEDPARVALDLTETDGRLRISARALGGEADPCVVQVVRYTPRETVAIHSGENAGHRLTYANIVRSWEVAAEWDGTGTLEVEVPRGDTPVAVIVQRRGHRAILAAARLE